jgi:hypothetical protein
LHEVLGSELARLVVNNKKLFDLVKGLITESIGLAFAFASSVDGLLMDAWFRVGN